MHEYVQNWTPSVDESVDADSHTVPDPHVFDVSVEEHVSYGAMLPPPHASATSATKSAEPRDRESVIVRSER
jgi:hypothetical protein